jgi:acyl-coenzyme A synthetase/AMP-(fatty) acid ligase
MITAEGDGSLYFFDRKKSIVRRSGENIAVLEVEAVLATDPRIKAAAVTPAPDELRGEEVFAFIVLADDHRSDAPEALADSIARACAAKLAYHKVPGYIAFVDELPVSSTQKLRRGEIKTEAARLVAEGGAIDLRSLKAALRKQ